MGQAHQIVKSFLEVVAATPALNVLMVGGVHHGVRTDTETKRPYGFISVEEQGRVYQSGGTALVDYEITFQIVGGQSVGWVGSAQDVFAAVFNISRNLPSVIGQVIILMPTGGTIVEDPDSEFGKDIIVGTQTWQVSIQEGEQISF